MFTHYVILIFTDSYDRLGMLNPSRLHVNFWDASKKWVAAVKMARESRWGKI